MNICIINTLIIGGSGEFLLRGRLSGNCGFSAGAGAALWGVWKTVLKSAELSQFSRLAVQEGVRTSNYLKREIKKLSK